MIAPVLIALIRARLRKAIGSNDDLWSAPGRGLHSCGGQRHADATTDLGLEPFHQGPIIGRYEIEIDGSRFQIAMAKQFLNERIRDNIENGVHGECMAQAASAGFDAIDAGCSHRRLHDLPAGSAAKAPQLLRCAVVVQGLGGADAVHAVQPHQIIAWQGDVAENGAPLLSALLKAAHRDEAALHVDVVKGQPVGDPRL